MPKIKFFLDFGKNLTDARRLWKKFNPDKIITSIKGKKNKFGFTEVTLKWKKRKKKRRR